MSLTKTNTVQHAPGDYLRVIWVIGIKDIADTLRNRTTLANILIVLALILAYKWMPALYKNDDTFLVVYDSSRSELVTKLADSPAFNPLQARSLGDLAGYLDDYDVRELALVIPPDFDQQVAAGQPVVLDGYTTWANRKTAGTLKTKYEQQLSELVGQTVRINIAEVYYPQHDSLGPIRWTAVSLVLTVFFTSMLVVPHLMFEEKHSKTLDSLLISPASASQFVLGKAFAGLVYCSLAAIIVLALNWEFIVSWGIAAVATLCALLFAIGLGLLAGIFCESKQQLMVWALIPAQILLVPVFLTVMEPILPDSIRAVLPWFPTVSQAILLRYAFSDGASLAQVLTHLGIALVGALIVLALVVWRVGRSDR
jgi:ABC-type Na+ efflux pump permease subunit